MNIYEQFYKLLKTLLSKNIFLIRKYKEETFEVKGYDKYFEVYSGLASMKDTTDPIYQQNHRYERAKAGGRSIIAKEKNWKAIEKFIHHFQMTCKLRFSVRQKYSEKVEKRFLDLRKLKIEKV